MQFFFATPNVYIVSIRISSWSSSAWPRAVFFCRSFLRRLLSMCRATYGVFGYEKLSADELGLREMLSPDGVTKARKAALERLRSRYPGSGLHLWRDVYHALKDI